MRSSSVLSPESFLLRKPRAAAAAAKSLQSCPTLCNPIDGSPPGAPFPGILQARTLEWAAISFSNAFKWKVKVKSLSCIRLLATPWTAAHQAPLSMGFSRQEYWSGVPLPSPSWEPSMSHSECKWENRFCKTDWKGPEGVLFYLNGLALSIMKINYGVLTPFSFIHLSYWSFAFSVLRAEVICNSLSLVNETITLPWHSKLSEVQGEANSLSIPCLLWINNEPQKSPSAPIGSTGWDLSDLYL